MEGKEIIANTVTERHSADAGQVSRRGWEWVQNCMLGDQNKVFFV